jgi:anti-anti-sigma factor
MVILHLYGEIAQLEIERVSQLIASLKQCSHRKIILDLARVDHLHFQAVQRWALEAQSLRTQNGDLKIVRLSPEMKKILIFTGADQYLKDYSNNAEALLSFLKIPDSHGQPTGNEGREGEAVSQDEQKPEFWLH